MKINIILCLLFLINLKNTNFCSCPDVNKKYIASLKQASDLIIIGKPIENIFLSNDPMDFVVKFKIDSILKGHLSLKEILINQNNAGNCQIGLIKNKEYLITGTKIDFIKQTYSITQNSHNKKLDSLIKVDYMLLTNGCRSFKLNSVSAQKILKKN